jgi:predicted nucleic-acid-binding protein
VKSLDTNIALRLLLRDVPEQLGRIEALIDNSKPGSLAIADVVFFECAWILAGKIYNFNRELIGKLLLQIADIPQVNCSRAMLEKAVPLYVSYTSISFIDTCLSVHAELNNAAPLLTFDKRLARVLPETTQLL